MKRAFLVLGPESSGTRLMTRILIGAGCLGDDGEIQRLDDGIPDVPLVVWRRSIPHAGTWPVIPQMVANLRIAGHHVMAVVTTRAWYPMTQSQLAARHVPNLEVALTHLQRAYPFITGALTSNCVAYVMASYEMLVQRPEATLAWLSARLELELPAAKLYDGNAKWYGEV